MTRKSFAKPGETPVNARLEMTPDLVERAISRWVDLEAHPNYQGVGLACTPSLTVRLLLKNLLDELDRLDALFGSHEARLLQVRAQKTLFPMLPLPVLPLGDPQELELEQRRAAFLSAAQEFDSPTSALASAETAPAPEPVKNGKKKRSRSTSQAPQEPVFPDGILPGGEPGPPFRIRQRRKTSKKGEAR